MGSRIEELMSPALSRMPKQWKDALREQQQFFDEVRRVRNPLLICDYDGTLAPFQKDKMQAYPYPGVAKRFAALVQGGTRVAFVSGRPIAELMELLPLAAESEVWGMHGREHRTPDGEHAWFEPKPEQRRILDAAQDRLAGKGWSPFLERKIGSVAMHWRTLPEGSEMSEAEAVPSDPVHAGPGREGRTAREARVAAENVFGAYAGQNAMAVLPFDGGLELRTEDRTKAHAVEALLAQADPRAAAFLGDDLTDEDGFRVMRDRGGLGLLVRTNSRPSEAGFQLSPPEELFSFFDAWIQVQRGTGSGTAGKVL